jgi:Type IV secretory system Conjugative DNA transfer
MNARVKIMGRAGSGMAALLAGVSPLAIGTAYAAGSVPVETQVMRAFVAFVVVMVGYGVVQGLLRCFRFRGGMASFWTSKVGRWLIGRMAGTAVFGGLFGTGFYLLSYAFLPVMQMLLDLGVPVSTNMIGGIALAMTAGAAVSAWYLRTAAKVCIGKGTRPLRRFIRSLNMGRGGSSAFAGIFEEWACRWKPGMILLGASMFDRHWLVGVKDDRHQLTISSTGGGKGRSVILPNLLTYPGSVLCVDVKGQNAAVSAAQRRAMGQVVHVVDPMGALKDLGFTSARYNPLAELDPEDPDYTEQLDLIADALVIPSGEKNIYWDESARIVIAGVLDYIVRAEQQRLIEYQPEKQEAL